MLRRPPISTRTDTSFPTRRSSELAELVAREDLEPRKIAEVAPGAFAVTLDQRLAWRKPIVAFDAHAVSVWAVFIGPTHEQPAEIDERIAEGGHFPVDDRRQCAVIGIDDVADVIVAVNDAGLQLGWAMGYKPRADLFDVAEAVMAGPLRKARIACQLGCPAIDLALEKAIDPAEVTQAGGFGFDGGERREAVDKLQAHPMPDGGRGPRRLRQGNRRVEAIHRRHQVEDRAQHALVEATRDKLWMGN